MKYLAYSSANVSLCSPKAEQHNETEIMKIFFCETGLPFNMVGT